MIVTQTLIGIFGFISLGFIFSRVLRRNDIADVLWGLGFVGLAVLHAHESDGLSLRGKLVFGLTVFWGIRLAFYISRRMVHKPEDKRYANWRREWGKREPIRSFFQVFLLQGVIMGVIASPVVFVLRRPDAAVSAYDFIGLGMVVVGLCFEAVSDFQMLAFKSNSENRGKILNQGLWAYCRHPNYFGEILIWWGFFFFALSLEQGILTLISPLLLTFLLLKVSGVTMLEKVLAEKGRSFEDYTRSTRAIFPFGGKAVLIFFLLLTTLIALDALWLGGVMKSFYSDQLHPLARLQGSEWDPILWAAAGVYFAIAIGVQFFVLRPGQSQLEAVFKGALFGLAVYSVYEFTNISLVKGWPIEMALVDILWGAVLCASAAFVGQVVSENKKPKA